MSVSRVLTGFFFSALFLAGAYFLLPKFYEYKQIKVQLHAAQQESVKNEENREEVREQIEGLKTNPKTVAKIARDKLNLCLPGEKIYTFNDLEEATLSQHIKK